MSLKNRSPVFVCFLASLVLGTILWVKSAPPPYSFPGQEANVYWSHLVDIAHKWREGRILLRQASPFHDTAQILGDHTAR